MQNQTCGPSNTWKVNRKHRLSSRWTMRETTTTKKHGSVNKTQGIWEKSKRSRKSSTLQSRKRSQEMPLDLVKIGDLDSNSLKRPEEKEIWLKRIKTILFFGSQTTGRIKWTLEWIVPCCAQCIAYEILLGGLLLLRASSAPQTLRWCSLSNQGLIWWSLITCSFFPQLPANHHGSSVRWGLAPAI